MRTQTPWLFETPTILRAPYDVEFELEDESDGFENEMEWEIGPTINLDKAVTYNRNNSAKIGWQNYVDQIVQLIGFSTYTPDERTFAQAVANWQQKRGLKPDGMIGANTWAKMKAMLGIKPTAPKPAGSSAPFPIVNVLLPKEGSGYKTRTSNRYGLPETIQALQAIGRAWHSANSDRPLIMISDISKKGGGQLGNHKSHRIGLDVDISLMREIPKSNGSTKVCTIDPDYANKWRSHIRQLVDAIQRNGILKVKTIGYQDTSVGPKGVMSNWDDHRCHLHVRFCMPSKYKSQLNLALTYGSAKKPDYNC